jgi:hypothetical protein
MKAKLGKLSTGGDASIDVMRLLDTRMLIQASSGGGKSWMLRLLAEQIAGQVPTWIIDPEGEFASLREKLDLVLVGRQGELAADPRSAELLARRLMELRVSAVIDLVELKLPERRRFVKLFIESLMNLPQSLWRQLFVMFDEAHMFCPERSAGEAESTEAVIDLCSRGRKRGFAAVLATQRLSKLHKDAAAELTNVAIGPTTLDVDLKRAIDVLGINAGDKHLLRDLPSKTFYAFGPACLWTGVETFAAGDVQTTHPRPGQRHKLAAPKPSKAIARVVSELADLPKQAAEQAHDMTEARKQIGELKRELAHEKKGHPKAPAGAAPVQLSTASVDRALAQARAGWDRELKQERAASVVAIRERATRLKHAADLAGRIAKLCDVPDFVIPQSKIPVGIITPSIPRAARPVSQQPAGPEKRTVPKSSPAPAEGLTKTQQRIIDAVAWFESMGNPSPKLSQLGAVALIDTSGGYFANVASPLSAAGLIERGKGTVSLTDAGRALATPIEDAPTLEEYHASLRKRVKAMKNAGQRTIDMLDVIIGAGPEGVLTSEQIGDAMSMDHTGGYFSNVITPLSTAGLITRDRGEVKPTEILFPEGLV